MPDLVRLVTRKGKQVVNAKIKAIDKNFFEKSDGDIQALIVDVDTRDLIRIVLDSEDWRNKADVNDYLGLKDFKILEDAFEENVRVYLRLRSNVNKSIKRTALSSDAYKFFYFNNGITITCDTFSYPKTVRSPIIELSNIQVVNGGQTIHALYEAFIEDPSKFEDMDILCRIYRTANVELSTNIAEYTNSQNPVSRRDIRSIDWMQQRLEQEFLVKNLFYERKKNQHRDKAKGARLDAEKVGQVLMTFYNGMPAEAKNKKRLIFGDKYDEVFDDSVNADKVLLGYRLFEKIENEKSEIKDELIKDPNRYEKDSFILHASYYLLYLLSELSEKIGLERSQENINKIWKLYPLAKNILISIIKKEEASLEGYKEKYSHAAFFKSNKPKTRFETYDRETLEHWIAEGKKLVGTKGAA
jgi:hypothetical protein